MKKIMVICSKCGKKFEIDHAPEYDEKIKCPYCGHVISYLTKINETKRRLAYLGYF